VPHNRAVIFDLDDTLYPFRRFILSGFAACARRLERRRGVDARRAFHWMVRALREGAQGREVQTALTMLGLPDRLTPGLVDDIIWGRELSLRLPASTERTLIELRSLGWKIGVLTNGDPEVQARKVDALGLAAYVDAIVFATEHGGGKPDIASFHEAARRLHVRPSEVVFVGDDEWCDVNGALRAGMRPVRFVGHRLWPHGPSAADLVLKNISDLPRAAALLLADQQESHAA
jgi:HAD superfamily hydrolase (TIGR01549 family)